MKKLFLTTAALTLMLSMTAFAGQWKQDSKGWWYQNDDGSFYQNGWQSINGKYYYFTADGYMLADTTTPDGYRVGADGAWIQKPTFGFEDKNLKVSYKGHYLTTDYDNEKALVLQLDYTNLRDEPRASLLNALVEVYQDGVQLDSSYVRDLDIDSLTKVEKGSTLTVNYPFKLRSNSSVTVILGDWSDWLEKTSKTKYTLNLE